MRSETSRVLRMAHDVGWGAWLSALGRVDLIRISTPLLQDAAALQPPELRSLDAIHLATALRLGEDLARFVAYDTWLADAARAAGLVVDSPV